MAVMKLLNWFWLVGVPTSTNPWPASFSSTLKFLYIFFSIWGRLESEIWFYMSGDVCINDRDSPVEKNACQSVFREIFIFYIFVTQSGLMMNEKIFFIMQYRQYLGMTFVFTCVTQFYATTSDCILCYGKTT